MSYDSITPPSPSSLYDITPAQTYLKRIGAEPRSLLKAVVREQRGRYWQDIDVIRFDKSGLVKCKKDAHKPTEEEQKAIIEAFKGIKLPEIKPINRVIDPPGMIANAAIEDIYLFRDASNHIVMVQVRLEKDNGSKSYVPWTYWSDNCWRCCEHDDHLPLFNADRLKEASTVFIHEGAKAARHVQWMVDGETPDARQALAKHPWGNELKYAVHVGWIGGALSPERTDWSLINKSGVSKAIIVADNDDVGREAAGRITRALNLRTYLVQFDNRFPESFDLADVFPEKMFSPGAFLGPSLADLTQEITWATDRMKSGGKGRPSNKLRRHFVRGVAHITSTNHFIFLDDPTKLLTAKQFDDRMASRSHTGSLSKLVASEFQGVTTEACYRPDLPSGRCEINGQPAINTFVPTRMRPERGSVEPFVEFLNYLFPIAEDRREMERWTATLIGRPDIRMSYAPLLISETQGVGKTTWAEEILRPLVGSHNVSIPNEQQVVDSQFNSWCARVRLIVVSEIYSGHGWKAYHKLKPIITDKTVEVNEKHQPVFVIDNWAHMLACSNSMRAMRVDEPDRRWFFPTVTEAPWPREKFVDLRNYLANRGLRHILHWAQNFQDYVQPGERAPMSSRKREIIADSRSPAVKAVIELAESACETEEQPAAFTGSSIEAWVRRFVGDKLTDRPVELRRAMQQAGMVQLNGRMRINKRKEYVVANPQLTIALNGLDDDAKRTAVKSALKEPGEILPERM